MSASISNNNQISSFQNLSSKAQEQAILAKNAVTSNCKNGAIVLSEVAKKVATKVAEIIKQIFAKIKQVASAVAKKIEGLDLKNKVVIPTIEKTKVAANACATKANSAFGACKNFLLTK